MLLFLKKLRGTGGSRLGLTSNDSITVEHLLYGLLLVSGNDAAVALAEFIAGNISDFAILMNQKAESIGLVSSHFESPHGLDSDEHYTTAYELAFITDYALNNPTFKKIVSTKSYVITINGKFKNLNNTNELLDNLDGIYGVKTGFTNGANRCLVTSCKRGNLDIICVVLGCDTKKDRSSDTVKIINYIFNNFSTLNLKELISINFSKWQTENTNPIYINKGISQNVFLYFDENELPYDNIAIKKNSLDNVFTPIYIFSAQKAPLKSNTVVGKMEVLIDGKSYFSINILNSNFINIKSIWYYLHFFLANYFRNLYL